MRHLTETFRKASASVLAVSERQSLETLGREEKTAARNLSQGKIKVEEMEARKAKLTEDATTQEEKKDEVCIYALITGGNVLTHLYSWSRSSQPYKQTLPERSRSTTTTKVNERV